MTQLSDSSIAGYARSAGFSGDKLVMAIAIALAESGGNPLSRHNNIGRNGLVSSVDRGLWQINSVYHKEVNDACAFDPVCSAKAAYRISRGGTNWSQWTTYENQSYKKFMARATTASQQISPTSLSTATVSPPSIGSRGLALNISNLNEAGQQPVDVQTLGLDTDIMAAYRTILAYGLLFLVLFVIGKTRAGYAAIYYSEVLILLFLFATQYHFFIEALSPITHVTQPTTS